MKDSGSDGLQVKLGDDFVLGGGVDGAIFEIREVSFVPVSRSYGKFCCL